MTMLDIEPHQQTPGTLVILSHLTPTSDEVLDEHLIVSRALFPKAPWARTASQLAQHIGSGLLNRDISRIVVLAHGSRAGFQAGDRRITEKNVEDLTHVLETVARHARPGVTIDFLTCNSAYSRVAEKLSAKLPGVTVRMGYRRQWTPEFRFWGRYKQCVGGVCTEHGSRLYDLWLYLRYEVPSPRALFNP